MASQATPQVYGQASHDPAAELQRQMASAAAQSAAEQGARVAGEKAKHGFYEVKVGRCGKKWLLEVSLCSAFFLILCDICPADGGLESRWRST